MDRIYLFSTLFLSDVAKTHFSASANAKRLLNQDFQKCAMCFQSWIVLRSLGFICLWNGSNKIRTHVYLCTSQEDSLAWVHCLLKPCLLVGGKFIIVTEGFLSSAAHSVAIVGLDVSECDFCLLEALVLSSLEISRSKHSSSYTFRCDAG